MKWSHSSERGRRIFQTALSAALLIPRALCLKHAEAPLHPSYVCLCPAEISQTPQIRYVSAERAAGPFGPSSPAQGWCNQRRVHPTPGVIACMRAANRKGKKARQKRCVRWVQRSLPYRRAAAQRKDNKETCVGECAAGGNTQTFPVSAVGDRRGVDALGDLLVGCFLGDHRGFELSLRSVQGF